MGALDKILLVHNHYQQPGGEDTVFEADNVLLELMLEILFHESRF